MTKLGVFTGNDPADLKQFEGWLGKPVDGVLGFTGSQSWNDADPGWQLSSSFLGGTGRHINWSIPAWPDSGGVSAMREAAAGQHNGKYTDWANKILVSRAGDGDPIYVRTTWELGGEWFAWTAAAKEDPQAYVKAFQQFARAFHDVSPRFEIVWDFVPDRGPVEQWYPGDEAVDVISQDVYWHTQYSGTDAAAAFDRAVNGMGRGLAWVADFAEQHGKPVAISEWGVPGDGHDGAKYIELMRAWIESHNVVYADYWNSKAAYDGLLSDGGPPATAAKLKAMLLEGIQGGGTAPAPTPAPVPAPTPSPTPAAPVSLTAGSGPDSLDLKISQDAYQGDARYTVKVDGVQIGGALTAKASHAAGQSDTVTIKGDWAAGPHDVVVTFLNDAWGGTAATDRNLYLDGATYNGAAVGGAARALMGNGGAGFGLTDVAATANLDLQGTAGADSLAGGAGADRLRGLAGNDTLSGGAGNDALNGGAGADLLNGGAGNDYLLGGLGADTLTGGAGPDRFAIPTVAEGGDTILDFNAADGDRLDLRGVFGPSGQIHAKLTAGGFVEAGGVAGGVRISVDANGSGDGYAAMVTLNGLTVASLGNDFLIA